LAEKGLLHCIIMTATHANDLIRLVTRAFYNEECAIILDCLLRENRCLKDEELAQILRLHQKQVRKWLSELKADHLVKSENRQKEARNPGERPTAHLYWYVDYKHVVDVIKYRLHIIGRKFENERDREMQVQVYECPLCHHQYTAMDALILETNGWKCENCIVGLEEINSNDSAHQTHSQLKTLYAQIKPIIEAMKRVEANPIPKFPRHTIAMLGPIEDSIIGTAPSTGAYSASSHSHSTARSSGPGGIASGSIDVFVDIEGADSKPSASQQISAQAQHDVKAQPPWMISHSSSTSNAHAISHPANGTTSSASSSSSSTTTEGEPVDEGLYKAYILQYFAELQRQQTLASEGLKRPAEDAHEEDVAVRDKKRIKVEPTDMVFAKPQLQQVHENGIVHEHQPKTEETPADEPMVKVQGKLMPLSQIGEQEMELMTAEEYNEYGMIVMQYSVDSS
jgi:transcription initiation factor TFIIE subunit alpha